MSYAKMTEPIQMPFGLRIRMYRRNHVWDGGSDPQWEGTILRGEGAAHCKVQRLCAMSCAKNSWAGRDAVWVVVSGEPKESCTRWGAQCHHLANTTEPSMCGSNALDAVFLSN